MSPLWFLSNLLIGVFAFGLFATDIFVNAGQVVTGHLTPYFLTVCQPNYTSTDCRAHHQFINNGNICTGDLEVIEQARRSFPSKHAALSIYSALYATVSTWACLPKLRFCCDVSLTFPTTILSSLLYDFLSHRKYVSLTSYHTIDKITFLLNHSSS